LVSAVLLAAGLACASFALTLAQSGDWVRQVLPPAILGGVLLAAFVRRQRRSIEPILPLDTVRDPAFALLVVGSVVVHFLGFAVNLLVPYFLTRVLALGALAGGALLASSPVGILLGAALAVGLIRRLGPLRSAAFGAAVVIAGQFAIGSWTNDMSRILMFASLLLQGAGLGVFQAAYADIVVSTLPRRNRGVAGSLTMLTRTLGIVIAATVFGAALQFIESGRIAAGDEPRDAFVAAFQTVYLWSALLAGGLFALDCLRRRTRFGR